MEGRSISDLNGAAALARARRFGLAAALLFVVSLAMFWPGIALFDSLSQYRQALTGEYNDWHPPAMARLWSLFVAIGWRGQGPMFAVQLVLWWAGLGLTAAALARTRATRAAMAVLAIGLWPPLLGWQVAVLKDGQMAGALVAAFGLVAWYRLQARSIPLLALAAILVLLAYATLVRSNAVFASLPLAVALFPAWRWERWPSRLLLAGAGSLAVLTLAPILNQGLFAARSTGVEAAQPLFDMAGIVDRAGPDAVPLVPAGQWRAAQAQRCITPILWDAFASDRRCGFVQAGLHGQPRAQLFTAWHTAVTSHPAAYAGHRLAHWNATMRWLVPWQFPLTLPPAASEPKDQGLGSPGPAGALFNRATGWLALSPLGAPILAFAAALGVLALARPRQTPAHALAVALALSAVAIEASFLIVSISSDLRYHLWPMLASWLAVALLASGPVSRRGLAIAAAGLALVAATALAARLTLPPVGTSYEAAIGLEPPQGAGH